MIFMIILLIPILYLLTIYIKNSLEGLGKNHDNFYSKYEIPNEIISRSISLKLPDVEKSDFIPKIIFQTHEKIDLLQPYYIEHIKKTNPDWEYIFHDNNDRRKFVLENYGKKFLEKLDSFRRGCHKADLWRLCVLYKYGGCYMDADIYPLINFDNIVKSSKNKDFIISHTYINVFGNYYKERVANGLIIVKRGNEDIKRCLLNIMKIEKEELEGDERYFQILNVMTETLGKNFVSSFKEKNKLYRYKIYDENEKEIALSTRFDYMKKFYIF